MNEYLKPIIESQGPTLYYQPNIPGTRLYPDWLVWSAAHPYILIIECKLTHSIKAYNQLRNLYSPAIKRAYSVETRVLEICKQFDPRIKLPEEPRPVFSIDLDDLTEDRYYVFPYTGR